MSGGEFDGTEITSVGLGYRKLTYITVKSKLLVKVQLNAERRFEHNGHSCESRTSLPSTQKCRKGKHVTLFSSLNCTHPGTLSILFLWNDNKSQ